MQSLEYNRKQNMNSLEDDWAMLPTRRHFMGATGCGLGSLALSSLSDNANAAENSANQALNFVPKAKRVIYLFQSGAPSQFELFDHKPELEKQHGKDLPASFFKGQRQTGMTSRQKKQVCKSIYRFGRHGESGAEISENLPYLSSVADDICIVRSMTTEAINHDPAITFFQTGFQQAGRPSMGAWMS